LGIENLELKTQNSKLKIGIDLGSRKAKFAALEGGKIGRLADFDTVAFYKRFGRIEGDALALDLAATGLFTPTELAGAPIVVTGYGRNTLNLAGARVVSEIRAHASGALLQTGLKDFTMLDMGGQDTKVVLLRNGRLADFVMNDKCAASSGRYLENMAVILEVSLEELASHWEEPVKLDSTCGIFGESELIGQILRGHPIGSLCAGVNQTLVKRVLPMLKRFPTTQIVLVGGVACNQGVVKLLERASGLPVIVPPHPRHNGAIGCAFLGSGD
jgi:predicted CoA-substrate-specific enzyme activase